MFSMALLILIPIVAIIITFIVRYNILCEPNDFIFNYSAKTKYATKDHSYKFRVKRVGSGYRCYIEHAPSFRGRSTANYMPHYWVETGTDKHYVCWTGKIQYAEQAKTLCRNWADATQIFIDTGIPAPGFER